MPVTGSCLTFRVLSPVHAVVVVPRDDLESSEGTPLPALRDFRYSKVAERVCPCVQVKDEVCPIFRFMVLPRHTQHSNSGLFCVDGNSRTRRCRIHPAASVGLAVHHNPKHAKRVGANITARLVRTRVWAAGKL